MRATRVSVAFAMAAAVVGLTVAYAAGIVNNPDASAVYLLQYRFAHLVPAYEAMTLWDSAVRSADEFHKPEAIRQADANLRAKAASLESVKTIVVNLGSRFTEYDTQYNEYDFDINDGSYIPYTAFGREVRIALTNGTKAQIWKLAPKDAEDVLRKNRGDKFATLVLTLSLLDSPPAVQGEPMVLNAKIVGYDVLAHFGSARLGSIVVADTP